MSATTRSASTEPAAVGAPKPASSTAVHPSARRMPAPSSSRCVDSDSIAAVTSPLKSSVYAAMASRDGCSTTAPPTRSKRVPNACCAMSTVLRGRFTGSVTVTMVSATGSAAKGSVRATPTLRTERTAEATTASATPAKAISSAKAPMRSSPRAAAEPVG